MYCPLRALKMGLGGRAFAKTSRNMIDRMRGGKRPGQLGGGRGGGG